MAEHKNRDHALLSASGSHRWLNCLPSAKLEEQFPDTTSEAALEGTLAHEICEIKIGAVDANLLAEKRQHALYQSEMEHYTDEYVEFVRRQKMGYEVEPFMAIEKRIDLTEYIPDGFGSVDCILIGGNTIEVIDFKYGKGVPVDAERNPQMMLYALGAYEAYKLLYKFETVRMTIFQPRIDNSNTWECSISELLMFGAEVKAKAKVAYDGGGKFEPGEWCRFCRARGTCRARADHSIRLAFEDGFGEKGPLLNNDEIGHYLELGESVAKWVEDLRAYALNECLDGRAVAGYKAVAGRTSRNWDDADKAFADLVANGVDEAMLYERKPTTVAKLEKALGKKTFAEVAGSHVVKTDGKPTLVPEDDKREPINALEKAFK